MQSSANATKARRQRILERGADRLAYITGDISKQQALRGSPGTPSPASSPPVHPTADDSGNDGQDGQDVHDFKQHVPDSRLSQISSEAPGLMPAPASMGRLLDGTTMTASTVEASSCDSPQFKITKKSHTAYVTNIVQGIDISESLRALAAFVVAAFVATESVLSSCSHPWGTTLRVFSPAWPLVIVFITDMTLVVGAYLICCQTKLYCKDMGDRSSQTEMLDDTFDKMSNALHVVGHIEDILNVGLLFRKAIGAILLDCSIYAVTLVCSISISNYLLPCYRGH